MYLSQTVRPVPRGGSKGSGEPPFLSKCEKVKGQEMVKRQETVKRQERVCIFFGPDRTNGPGYTDHVHPQYFAHWNKSRRTYLDERIAMLQCL